MAFRSSRAARIRAGSRTLAAGLRLLPVRRGQGSGASHQCPPPGLGTQARDWGCAPLGAPRLGSPPCTSRTLRPPPPARSAPLTCSPRAAAVHEAQRGLGSSLSVSFSGGLRLSAAAVRPSPAHFVTRSLSGRGKLVPSPERSPPDSSAGRGGPGRAGLHVQPSRRGVFRPGREEPQEVGRFRSSRAWLGVPGARGTSLRDRPSHFLFHANTRGWGRYYLLHLQYKKQ